MSSPELDVSSDNFSSKYRPLAELGEGGTANVYLAVVRGPAGFNKLVVLKVLKRQMAEDPELRVGFLREARLSARLNHPNVVSVHEVTELGGVPVMVMEYLEGQPLSAILAHAGDKLTLGQHLRIISDALTGLHYSHELVDYSGKHMNLVHRDVTPQNVIVTYDGMVKVLDFGIAKMSGRQGHTETGVIKGKLRYMPAEQIAGDELDRRADVFAAGVMIWEAATGQRLWQDLGEATVMMKVLNGEIPLASSVNPSVHPELERICAKAMAHDREDRYATADDLRRDLEDFIATHTNRVSGAELGKNLAQWFEQDRKERKNVIEAKLSSEESFTWTGIQPLTLSPSPTGTRAAKKRHSNRLLSGSVVLLGVVVVGSTVALLNRPSPPAEIQSPQDSEPQKSLVRITVFPDMASLFVDGKRVPENPYVREVPADRSWHTARAEAPGHIAAEKRYRQAGDVDLVIALQREPVKEKPPAPVASEDKPKVTRRNWGRPKPPKPQPSAQGTQNPKCTPPYYFDDAGVKRFRPECL